MTAQPNNIRPRVHFLGSSQNYPEPDFKSKRGKSHIMMGKKDDLPNYIKSLLPMSPAHTNIINRTAMFISGEGIDLDGASKALQDFVANEDENLFDNFDLNEIIPKIARDLKMHGHFMLNIRWNRAGDKISHISYVDVCQFRIEEEEGQHQSEGVKYYAQRADWTKRESDADPKVIHQGFSTKYNRGNGASQIIHVKLDNSYSSVYGMPDWWASRLYIEQQGLIINHTSNHTKRGFNPSVVIQVPTMPPTDEEMSTEHEAFKDFLQGTDNAGQSVLTYGEQQITFERFEGSTTPDHFEWLSKMTLDGIRSGHGLMGKAELFSISSGQESGLQFSKDSLLTEWVAYSATVVKGYQNIITKTLSKLAKINGIEDDINIIQFDVEPLINLILDGGNNQPQTPEE